MFGSKIWLILLSLILAANFGCAKQPKASDFMPGAEPDGFRGLKWGIKTHLIWKQFKYIDKQTHRRLTVYTKHDEDLQIEGIPLESIRYYFWKEMFYAVTVSTKGEVHFNLLNREMLRQYGRAGAEEVTDQWRKYIWRGAHTDAELTFINFEEQGSLRIEQKASAAEARKESLKVIESQQ